MFRRLWKKLWKTLHPSWIFVAICAGIIAGAVAALFFRSTVFSSSLWLVFITIVFIFGFLKPSYVFFILAFSGGMILSFFRTSGEIIGEELIKQFVGEEITISGVIAEDPNFDEDKITLKLKDLEFENEKIKGTIYVQLGGTETEVKRADKISLKGKMSAGFGSFSGAMYRPIIVGIARPEPRDPFLELRDWFSSNVKQFMPEKESSLALAYLLGMKNGLDDEILEALKIIGLTHIVVASGTHLGIIVAVVRKIFGKISRFSGLLFSILFILVFGGMIGWTASILRATIVTVLSLLMWYVGRKFEGWRIILISMAVTLIFNPMFIVNLGWLLSFAAFSGILILEPKLEKLLFGEKKIGKILKIILVSVAAQIMCLPILVYYFGAFSLISFIANVLILPTMPVVMGMTFLTGLCGGVEFLGGALGIVTKILIDCHLIIINFFSEQKMFLVQIGAKNSLVFLFYLPIVAILLVGTIKKSRQRRMMARL